MAIEKPLEFIQCEENTCFWQVQNTSTQKYWRLPRCILYIYIVTNMISSLYEITNYKWKLDNHLFKIMTFIEPIRTCFIAPRATAEYRSALFQRALGPLDMMQTSLLNGMAYSLRLQMVIMKSNLVRNVFLWVISWSVILGHRSKFNVTIMHFSHSSQIR